MFQKSKHHINLLCEKYLQPKNIWEENDLIFKPLLYFTAFPFNLKDANNIICSKLYLIFPASCAIFCLVVVLYLLTSNYITNHFGPQTHLQNTTMFLQLFFGITCLIAISISLNFFKTNQ